MLSSFQVYGKCITLRHDSHAFFALMFQPSLRSLASFPILSSYPGLVLRTLRCHTCLPDPLRNLLASPGWPNSTLLPLTRRMHSYTQCRNVHVKTRRLRTKQIMRILEKLSIYSLAYLKTYLFLPLIRWKRLCLPLSI